MNKILVVNVILLFSFQSLFSQRDYSNELKQESKVLSKVYNLDEAQEIRLNEVLQHKFDQLNEIEDLKSLDKPKYLSKRRSIFVGTEGSLQLLLNKKQRLKYNENQIQLRSSRANEVKKMISANADEEKIKDLQSGVKEY